MEQTERIDARDLNLNEKLINGTELVMTKFVLENCPLIRLILDTKIIAKIQKLPVISQISRTRPVRFIKSSFWNVSDSEQSRFWTGSEL